jgi:hypothetical protein
VGQKNSTAHTFMSCEGHIIVLSKRKKECMLWILNAKKELEMNYSVFFRKLNYRTITQIISQKPLNTISSKSNDKFLMCCKTEIRLKLLHAWPPSLKIHVFAYKTHTGSVTKYTLRC